MTHPGNSEYVLVPREPTAVMIDSVEGWKMRADGPAYVWDVMVAAAPAQPSSWHRIDDPVNPAPKDGTILIYEPDWLHPWCRVTAARWVEPKRRFESADRHHAGATHWMPLPPPPDEG